MGLTGPGGPQTPFEADITAQPDALRAFAQAPNDAELTGLLGRPYGRIVLTGMGSSHFAALPTWRRLVAAGHPAWWVDSGQLLDAPQLITADTLLVVTSQSGASGEVVALLDVLQQEQHLATVIGITNDAASPLASRAAGFIALHSGPEATVSTKSYLNTLAAQQQLGCLLTGTPTDDLADTAEAVAAVTAAAVVDDIAADFAATPTARLVFVGFADHAATALYAGLITKEAAKVPAEGYIGGQFRHGPLELAGPGLVAVLFTGGHPPADSPRQLATDLLAAGSTVLTVGDLGVPGAIQLTAPTATLLSQLATGAVAAQHLTVALARARHITPGAFGYGRKVTTAL